MNKPWTIECSMVLYSLCHFHIGLVTRLTTFSVPSAWTCGSPGRSEFTARDRALDLHESCIRPLFHSAPLPNGAGPGEYHIRLQAAAHLHVPTRTAVQLAPGIVMQPEVHRHDSILIARVAIMCCQACLLIVCQQFISLSLRLR